SEISVTIDPNTPEDSEFWVEVTAPTGYKFKIRTLRLITPKEVSANIVVDTRRTTGLELLTTNQPAEKDRLYDTIAIWGDEIVCSKISLYAKTTTLTTASRQVKLEYSGSLIWE
ncbi:MAG: hypothetical protein ACTSVW_00345, partial [Candidatus Njordarchaeales archaeon]